MGARLSLRLVTTLRCAARRHAGALFAVTLACMAGRVQADNPGNPANGHVVRDP